MKKVIGFAAILGLSICATMAFADEQTQNCGNEKSLVTIILETILGTEAPATGCEQLDDGYNGTLPG